MQLWRHPHLQVARRSEGFRVLAAPATQGAARASTGMQRGPDWRQRDGVAPLDLFMETQAGVRGVEDEGLPDRMPETGEFVLRVSGHETRRIRCPLSIALRLRHRVRPSRGVTGFEAVGEDRCSKALSLDALIKSIAAIRSRALPNHNKGPIPASADRRKSLKRVRVGIH